MSETEPDFRWIAAIADGSLDTGALTEAAATTLLRHGVAGPAARLIPTGRPATPAEQLLLAGRKRQLMQTMAVVGGTKRVNAILTAAEIPHLFIKGPALALQTTGAWRDRRSCDVDLLVAPEDCGRVHASLLATGLSRYDKVETAPSALMIWAHCEVGYAGLATPLDVHWRLDATAGLCDLPFSDLQARREMVMLEGSAVPTFGKVDAWIFTAIHGTRSEWFGWKWLLDAYIQFAALTPEQRQDARHRAKHAGCLKAILLTEALVLACGLADSTSPALPAWATRQAQEILLETREGKLATFSVGQAMRRKVDAVAMAPSAMVAASGFARAVGRTLATPAKYRRHVLTSLGLRQKAKP
jgi:hypothetical protein